MILNAYKEISVRKFNRFNKKFTVKKMLMENMYKNI